MRAKLIIILTLVFVSGCVNNTPSNTNPLKLEIDVYPNPVFEGEKLILSANIENNAMKSYNAINIQLFNPGLFVISPSCKIVGKRELKPFEIANLECELIAPHVFAERQTDLGIAASFDTTLNDVEAVQVVSKDEYRRQELRGKLSGGQQTKTVTDGNIEMTIEYPSALPLVKKDEPQYLHIYLRNVGEGYGTIKNFVITSQIVGRCDTPKTPFGLEKEKTITCPLILNENYLSVKELIFNINYNYEIIKTKTVLIKK